HGLSEIGRQFGGRVRRRRVTEIPDVQALRPVQCLVRGERLVDVEQEVVTALDQQGRRRDRGELRGRRAGGGECCGRREVGARRQSGRRCEQLRVPPARRNEPGEQLHESGLRQRLRSE